MKKGILFFVVLIAAAGAYVKFHETKRSVVIDAPIARVWAYVSDSTKAGDWSVYFHHISPLPGIPDGNVGALRRCFRRADEKGNYWDEEVVRIEAPTFREIRTYNLTGFAIEGIERAEFRVTQNYESLGPNQTRLTFGTSYLRPFDLGVISKLLPSIDETARIFEVNLANIKAQIEGRPRPHPYEPTHPFDPKI